MTGKGEEGRGKRRFVQRAASSEQGAGSGGGLACACCVAAKREQGAGSGTSLARVRSGVGIPTLEHVLLRPAPLPAPRSPLNRDGDRMWGRCPP